MNPLVYVGLALLGLSLALLAGARTRRAASPLLLRDLLDPAERVVLDGAHDPTTHPKARRAAQRAILAGLALRHAGRTDDAEALFEAARDARFADDHALEALNRDARAALANQVAPERDR